MLSYVCKNLYQHHRNINIRDGGILGVAYYCCFRKKCIIVEKIGVNFIQPNQVRMDTVSAKRQPEQAWLEWTDSWPGTGDPGPSPIIFFKENPSPIIRIIPAPIHVLFFLRKPSMSSSSGPVQQWFSTVPYWQWAPWGTEGMPCLAGWPGHYRTTPGCTAPAAMSQWVTMNAIALAGLALVVEKWFATHG